MSAPLNQHFPPGLVKIVRSFFRRDPDESHPKRLVKLFDEDTRLSFLGYNLRIAFQTKVCWIYLTQGLMEFLYRQIGDMKVLEVCCGHGLMATWLASKDIDIIATDVKVSYVIQTDDVKLQELMEEGVKPFPRKHSLIPIWRLNAVHAVSKFSNRNVLLICWPPVGGKFIVDVVKEFLKTREGKYVRIISIGDHCTDECEDPITGCIEFNELLREKLSNSAMYNHINFPENNIKPYYSTANVYVGVVEKEDHLN